jgi:hypothetical protein
MLNLEANRRHEQQLADVICSLNNIGAAATLGAIP